MKNWIFQKQDEDVAKSLQSFIPEKVFDVHAHIYRVVDLHLATAHLLTEHVAEVSIDVWREQQERQLGTGKMADGLFFPIPVITANVDRQNRYLLQQLEHHPDSRGLVLVRPKETIVWHSFRLNMNEQRCCERCIP